MFASQSSTFNVQTFLTQWYEHFQRNGNYNMFKVISALTRKNVYTYIVYRFSANEEPFKVSALRSKIPPNIFFEQNLARIIY